MGDALGFAIRPAALPDAARLPAGFEFMQVSVGGRQTLLALGARRDGGAGSTDEFWYSPQSELVHLRNGRVWRVLGMTAEWRDQHASPPAWTDVPHSGEAVVWQRRVDRMPGYRWNETEQVQTRRLNTPVPEVVAKAWPQALWFEDVVQGKDALGQPWQYTQRFALLQGRVLYSEQCIARDLCIALTKLEP